MPEVLALVGTTTLDEPIVVGLIADVSGWIDRELVGACDNQTPEQLEAIERYLSAHLITKGGANGGVTRVLKRSTRSDITDEYETSGTGAEDTPTRFAQVAASFDPCGIVGEKWLGKRRARGSFIRGYAEV